MAVTIPQRQLALLQQVRASSTNDTGTSHTMVAPRSRSHECLLWVLTAFLEVWAKLHIPAVSRSDRDITFCRKSTTG